MRLAEYMQKNGLTDEKFAEICGVDRSLVTRYRQGKRRPGYDTMSLIDKMTGGNVSFRDWSLLHEAAE